VADVTLDKLIRDAQTLPVDQQRRLIKVLAASVFQTPTRKTIEQIAAEQGRGPLKFSKIRELGSFFPEEENVDDLIQAVRTLRQDRSPRTLT
jgi:hypothetical protein